MLFFMDLSLLNDRDMQVVNIVVSGSFNQKVDFDFMIDSMPSFKYNPKKYHGGYLLLSNHKATIYKSGKYIITGIKEFDEILVVYDEMKEKLNNVLIVSDFSPPTIQNIVIYTSLPNEINLRRFYEFLLSRNEDVQYDPEIFAGLTWRSDRGSANIYKNGRMLILGVKSIEEAEQVRKKMFVLANQYY